MAEVVKELEFSLEQQEIHEKRVDYSQPAPISDGVDYSYDSEAPGRQLLGNSRAFFQVTTVVLKLRMHCEACAQEIRKRILRMKGVESVEPDLKASQVSVKGTFEVPQLVDYVYKRIGKKVGIIKQVPEPKKEDKGKEEKMDCGEKKQEIKVDADLGAENDMEKHKQKEENKDCGDGEEGAKADGSTAGGDERGDVTKVVDLRKREYYYNPQSCILQDPELKKEDDKGKEEKKDGGEKVEKKRPTLAPKDKEKHKQIEEIKDCDGGEEGAKSDDPAAGGSCGGDDTKVKHLYKTEYYYYKPHSLLQPSPNTMYTRYSYNQPAPMFSDEMFSDENPHSCTVM